MQSTLDGTNISHQWKRKVIFPTTFGWDMWVSGRVGISHFFGFEVCQWLQTWKLRWIQHTPNCQTKQIDIFKEVTLKETSKLLVSGSLFSGAVGGWLVGGPLHHTNLISTVGRHYAPSDWGCWHFLWFLGKWSNFITVILLQRGWSQPSTIVEAVHCIEVWEPAV